MREGPLPEKGKEIDEIEGKIRIASNGETRCKPIPDSRAEYSKESVLGET